MRIQSEGVFYGIIYGESNPDINGLACLTRNEIVMRDEKIICKSHKLEIQEHSKTVLICDSETLVQQLSATL